MIGLKKTIASRVVYCAGNTALISAARNGHYAVIRELLQRGADVDAETNNGENALGKSCGPCYVVWWVETRVCT